MSKSNLGAWDIQEYFVVDLLHVIKVNGMLIVKPL